MRCAWGLPSISLASEKALRIQRMDWKKWSGKAAQYASDGAVEKTAEFALTKVGPYRVAGIIANLLMLGALVVAVGGWALHYYAGYAATATVLYVVAALVFVVGLIINRVKNYLFNKAKGALKTGVDWATGEVKRRYADGQTPDATTSPVDPAFGIDAAAGKAVDDKGSTPVKR